MDGSEAIRGGDLSGLYAPRQQLHADDTQPWNWKAVMCRTRTHKYIRRLGETDELYDLKADPLEEINQIDNPAYADVLAALRERLTDWYMETCDVVPRELDQRGFG